MLGILPPTPVVVVVITVIVVIGVVVVFVRVRRQSWTGYSDKRLWEWMKLLIVPIFIAGATAVFSVLSTQTQQQIEDDRVRQAVLQSYIQDMTGLLLDKHLATSEPDQPVRDIARSSTLAAVRQLDTERKAILLLFLYESDLIRPIDPVISLRGADLLGANLSGANLRGAWLGGIDLNSAILPGADLRDADLNNANLSNANLSNANLSNAYLVNANLSNATLRGVDLNYAKLMDANLEIVKLFGSKLWNADLTSANLLGANLSNAKLSDDTLLVNATLRGVDLSGAEGWTNDHSLQVASLSGFMPDGTWMTEEEWEEFKKRYRP
jgi:uncharacterized protein YjbI with pentapeptide repeats